MDIKSCVIKSRSIRRYENSYRIEYDILRDFVDTTRYTPSSSNTQPLKYYISNENPENSLIRKNTRWAGRLKNYFGPSPEESPSAYIIVCIDKNIAGSEGGFDKDIGIVAQTIALCAAEKDLGCCMIGSFKKDELIRGLRLPENIIPRLVIAIGKPAENPVLEDVGKDGNISYYRDEKGIHHVPKRRTDDLIIGV